MGDDGRKCCSLIIMILQNVNKGNLFAIKLASKCMCQSIENKTKTKESKMAEKKFQSKKS